MGIEDFGPQFLHQKDPTLHTDPVVEHEWKRKKLKGEKTSNKPADKIAGFMKVLEQTHLGHSDDKRVLDRVKDYYHKEYVMSEADVPESYFDNQKRIYREQGRGNVEIQENERKQLIDVIRSDQRSTLDNWINYFTSSDSSSFPMWSKYWAFNGMTKLSTYDKEKHSFGNRDKKTVAPFADLDREALAYTIDAVIKKAKGENTPLEQEDPEFKKLLSGANFGKLYAYAIEKVTPAKENALENTSGEWIKYDKGSNHMPLVKSLQGYGTGWCTAGENTAQGQLKSGDFYVYYSYSKNNKPIIPRIAIRMEEDRIAEVRGIAKEQNLDPYMGDVVTEKLKQFPDGDLYKKKVDDMKKLTSIEKKSKSEQELDRDEIRFLYEIDSEINGFGYNKDPRIQEIISHRDIKSDISLVTGYKKEEISTTQEEALSGNIKFHYGNIDLSNFSSLESLVLPDIIIGNVDLSKLESINELILPKTLRGTLNLHKLTSTKELNLPETMNGDIYLDSIIKIDKLTLPKTINGDLNLYSLKSLIDIILPKTINGDLNLHGITSAQGLKLPDIVNGSLLLGITSAQGLKLPDIIGKGIYLSITSAQGLKLPEIINGTLDLGRLKSAEGLILPKKINRDLRLNRLISIEKLNLDQTIIDGKIDFTDLPSTEKEKFKNKYPNIKILEIKY